MTNVDRLRAARRGGQNALPPAPGGHRTTTDPETLASALGGEVEEAQFGPCPVVHAWLDVDGQDAAACHGRSRGVTSASDQLVRSFPRHELATARDTISSGGLATMCGHGDGGVDPDMGLHEGTLFFDLETTGLSGGSGTVAFVVGFGRFENRRFHVWQYVLPSFSGERRLLAAVTATVSSAHTLVSFNGKSFDVPFMEMRWLYHRLDSPLTRLRHLDMVHLARRLWGPETGGLGALETRVLGFTRRDDVAGFEIPSRYFDYLRSGNPSPLRAVLTHNVLDLASLAVLTARACSLVDDGPATTTDPRQCLGLGRIYERGGRVTEAVRCFESAADWWTHRPGGLSRAHDIDVRAEALFRVASWSRHDKRYADAAHAWQQLLDLRRTPGLFEREALRALAVYHEHRLKDVGRALTFARRAYDAEQTTCRRRDGRKRLRRLERRVAAVRLPGT